MYRKILVALDRSETHQQVLEEAIALAKSLSADLHLVHVLSYEDTHAPGLKEKGTEDYERRWTVFEQDGKTLLENALAQATDAGISTVYTLMSGKAGRALCEVAERWQADLILIGRRQISGIQEFILGSVSNYVVHSAPCSVFIIQGKIQHSSTGEEIASQTVTA